MEKIKVEVDIRDYQYWSQEELVSYLRSQGLDTTKGIAHYECLTRDYSRTFIGESLADKVVGCTKTVIGVVPITKPWESQ